MCGSAPPDDPAAAKPVTEDKKRGIRAILLGLHQQSRLYVQDQDGDENWHVYAVNLADNYHQGSDATGERGRADRRGQRARAGRNPHRAERSRSSSFTTSIASISSTGDRKLVAEKQAGLLPAT